MTYQSRLQDQSIAANQRIKEQNYWLNKLSGQWTKTMFPVDYNKKTSGTPGAPHMEIKTFRITGELFAQIMKLRNNSDSRLFMILVAVVTVLLYKYTGNKDILLGSPVLKQDIDAEFVNTTLVLRNPIRPNMSFKELLLQVRQTVLEAVENQNYPVETLPRQLDMTISGDEDFPLYDIAVLVENIHDINYLRHIKLNMIFSFLRGHQYIEGTVEYHPALYDKETIERIANHFTHLLGNLLANIDTQISNIEILEEEEKKQLLFDFNNTEMAYPGYKNFTIQQLFDEQVKRTPAQKVLSYNIDLSDIYKDLEVDVVSDYLSVKYEGCYFKKNPYVFKFTNNDFLSFLNISDEKNPGEIILLNTHKHDYIAVNQSTLAVVDCFNGKRSLKAIFTAVSKKDFQFLLYPLSFDHIEGASREEKRVRGIRRWPDLLVLIKMLYRYHLIELVDFEANPIDENSISDEIEKELNKCEKSQYAETGNEAILDNKRIRTVDASPTQVKSPVLLLGDTTGTATVGLLYLASYLRRHSIEAFCQWNDLNGTGISLKRNVEKLLTRIGPRVVGISMKWFQHIARVLEICRTVKNFDSSIEIVLGGNTAAYYWENFIRYEFVDYIVLGDGEVPLLKICKNEKKIPNCIYREGGQIIHNSITYIQDETDSSDIYLSHLDEIFVSKQDPFLASSFMVYTGKGCSMSCFYCGGCLEAQKRVYNRARPFLRGIEEIRKDIKKAQKYTSTLMFDFDLPNYETLDYYRKIFAGIDLSHHFCEIYFWKIPSAEFIELITGTFKYVYFSIDVASLSERHRAKLANLGVVKPQATDEELFRFFEQCEKYENVEVAISQIAGLPYFNEEDIEASHRVLSKIIDRYGFFTRIDWGRLHAQPGAPLADTSQAHGMKSYAQTFADYLGCSELNFKEAVYPGLDTTHYPFIYYEDDNLNSKISKYFADTEKTLKQFKEKKEQQLIITKTLTYEALNREANLLARLLRQKGVGADTLAAIMVRPSPEMIIGILAILKAGGAYLPIDPAYPASRVRYMLADSGVDVLLTDSENNIEKVSTIINLKDSSNYTGNREADLDMINRPGDTAYIIYTSGTTGRPKGVGVEHRSAVNTLLCRKAAYQMNEGDVTLQLFSYAFDGFVTSFFTPVISGAKVVLPNDGEIKDIARIRELIRAQRVTHFISVPSLFRVILDGINRDEFTSLKAVTLAGEKLLPGTLELAKQKLPSLEIANEYGVTETAVMSTIFRHQEQHQQIKIGKPVWNTCIYIVGEDLKLRPVGVPGEMCIAGAGVARGYLNQPELTAERFKRTVNCHLSLVISPFEPSTDDQWPMANDRSQKSLPNAHSPHSPIYLTGDQARWLPDGNIQFLGRIDQQVKIRGYRIELSEIENQLLRHKDIKEVIVISRGEPEAAYLCAYFVSDQMLPANELKNYLSETLPNYMIPAHFIPIAEIPLTPNGKLDRKALPENLSQESDQYIAPRNEKQKILVEIWAEVLNIDADVIGINTNFFELGGHSLNVALMTAKLHKRFDVKIPLIKIFENPTIEKIEGIISRSKTDEFKSIESVEEKDYYPLSSAQKRLFFMQLMDPENTSYNATSFSVLEGELLKKKFEDVFKTLIDRHEGLRTSFRLVEDRPAQRIHPQVDFCISYYEAGDKEAEAITDGFIQPFDLSQAPQLRVGLIKLAELKHVLMVDLHHITADGISMLILIKEFMAVYAGQSLPVLKVQYKDYARWQNSAPQQELIKQQEKYWEKEFSGNLPLLKLPLDYPRPPVQSFEGGKVYFTLGKEKVELLRKFSLEEDVTMYMLCLAIFFVFLYKLSGQEDLIIGTDSAGRGHPDLQNIIGMFVNTLAIRSYPGGEKTFRTFLKETKNRTLETFENQDYPFEELVEQLDVKRDLGRNPLFDVAFYFFNVDNMNPGDIPEVEIPGLIQKGYNKEDTTSKFDLSLMVDESEDKLSLTFEYCTKLFKKEKIEALVIIFQEILSTVLENRDIQLKDITVSHHLLVMNTQKREIQLNELDF